jgi:hypothetical protein
VRAELRQDSNTSQQDTGRITEMVVTEIIQAARTRADLSFRWPAAQRDRVIHLAIQQAHPVHRPAALPPGDRDTTTG